jgi:hypothetical protein
VIRLSRSADASELMILARFMWSSFFSRVNDGVEAALANAGPLKAAASLGGSRYRFKSTAFWDRIWDTDTLRVPRREEKRL